MSYTIRTYAQKEFTTYPGKDVLGGIGEKAKTLIIGAFISREKLAASVQFASDFAAALSKSLPGTKVMLTDDRQSKE